MEELEKDALDQWNASQLLRKNQRVLKMKCFQSWKTLTLQQLQQQLQETRERLEETRRDLKESSFEPQRGFSSISCRSNDQMKQQLEQLKAEQAELEAKTAEVRQRLAMLQKLI